MGCRLLLVLLCLAPISGCGGGPHGPPSALDLAGQDVRPLEHSKARATVLVFTSTDCPISNRYAPEIARIGQEFAPRGVRFWLVYPNRDESPEAIRRHVLEFGYPLEPLRDVEHDLVRSAGVRVTPEVAVFDPEGRVAYRGRIDDRYVDFGKSRPAPTRHDLAEALEAILAGRSVPQTTTTAIGCLIPDPD